MVVVYVYWPVGKNQLWESVLAYIFLPLFFYYKAHEITCDKKHNNLRSLDCYQNVRKDWKRPRYGDILLTFLNTWCTKL